MEEKYSAVGDVFYLISILVMPLVLSVLLDQTGYGNTSAGAQSFVAGVLFVMYLASCFPFLKPVFTFFGIAYAK